MSYSSYTDMAARYDVRVLGDLCSDTGVRLTTVQLASDTHLQAAMDDAASMINSAAFADERYTTADLSSLTGTDKALLLRINCDLAYALLAQRRGTDVRTLPQYAQALEWIQRLRDGERVFNLASVEDAGLVDASFPDTTAISSVNLLRDDATPFYFPVRREQKVP